MASRRKQLKVMRQLADQAMADISEELGTRRTVTPPSEQLIDVFRPAYDEIGRVIDSPDLSESDVVDIVRNAVDRGMRLDWSRTVQTAFWGRFTIYGILAHLTVPNQDWLYNALLTAGGLSRGRTGSQPLVGIV